MTFVDELAQAALRGFFGDSEGFKNMEADAARKAAAREVRKVLARYFAWWAEPVVKKTSVIVSAHAARVPSAHLGTNGVKKESS